MGSKNVSNLTTDPLVIGKTIPSCHEMNGSLFDIISPNFPHTNLQHDPLSSCHDPELFTKSTNIDHDGIINAIKSNQNTLSILSLNCQSLNSKFSEITLLLQFLRDENISLDMLCLQETWFSSDNVSLLEIQGYNMIN